MTSPRQHEDHVDIRLGRHEIVLSRRYELASIANDILLGIWFVVGTIFFFSTETMTAGTWLFLIGSVQMLLRPMIRLARLTHLRRVGVAHPENPMGY